MSIKAVVFDIGGVLEDNTPSGWQGKWEQKLSLPTDSLAEKLEKLWRAGSYGWITLEEVHLQLRNILGINEIQTQEMMDDVWLEYLGSLKHEMYAYFKKLRPKYMTALLSNSFVGAREKEQERYCFEENCDFIIYSHEVGLYKPDHQIYALACQYWKLMPEEIVFLDDVKTFVEAAQEFGFQSVLFQSTKQAIAEIDELVQNG